MENIRAWRNRHYQFRIELLKLSKKIIDANEPEDVAFYQEVCEQYATHIKKIEKACHAELGIVICNCSFDPEQCHK